MNRLDYLKGVLGRRGLSLEEEKWEKLEKFHELLQLWGRKVALVSKGDLKKGLEKHFADALLVIPFIEGKKVIDLGSGAGFPGIPLAIALEDKQFLLVESKKKKAFFLKEVKRELGLLNVEVVNARWEEVECDADTAVAKAAGDVEFLFPHIGHLLKEGGTLLLYSSRKRGDLDPYRVERIVSPLRESPFYLLFFKREYCIEFSSQRSV